jgi:hypothetical protein
VYELAELLARRDQRPEAVLHELGVGLRGLRVPLDVVALELHVVSQQLAHVVLGAPQRGRLEALRRRR